MFKNFTSGQKSTPPGQPPDQQPSSLPNRPFKFGGFNKGGKGLKDQEGTELKKGSSLSPGQKSTSPGQTGEGSSTPGRKSTLPGHTKKGSSLSPGISSGRKSPEELTQDYILLIRYIYYIKEFLPELFPARDQWPDSGDGYPSFYPDQHPSKDVTHEYLLLLLYYQYFAEFRFSFENDMFFPGNSMPGGFMQDYYLLLIYYRYYMEYHHQFGLGRYFGSSGYYSRSGYSRQDHLLLLLYYRYYMNYRLLFDYEGDLLPEYYGYLDRFRSGNLTREYLLSLIYYKYFEDFRIWFELDWQRLEYLRYKYSNISLSFGPGQQFEESSMQEYLLLLLRYYYTEFHLTLEFENSTDYFESLLPFQTDMLSPGDLPVNVLEELRLRFQTEFANGSMSSPSFASQLILRILNSLAQFQISMMGIYTKLNGTIRINDIKRAKITGEKVLERIELALIDNTLSGAMAEEEQLEATISEISGLVEDVITNSMKTMALIVPLIRNGTVRRNDNEDVLVEKAVLGGFYGLWHESSLNASRPHNKSQTAPIPSNDKKQFSTDLKKLYEEQFEGFLRIPIKCVRTSSGETKCNQTSAISNGQHWQPDKSKGEMFTGLKLNDHEIIRHGPISRVESIIIGNATVIQQSNSTLSTAFPYYPLKMSNNSTTV
ncbi:unnamed protein product [Cylicocyclus nassatus]|uniref:Uncharacterized protein n=1 Tax=Cylicocyclus nassatus TaxID=53992 RepID=A0AA36MDH5_CYLNA|nr:unnamed protein product [Cylicocyclus nassatus]